MTQPGQLSGQTLAFGTAGGGFESRRQPPRVRCSSVGCGPDAALLVYRCNLTVVPVSNPQTPHTVLDKCLYFFADFVTYFEFDFFISNCDVLISFFQVMIENIYRIVMKVSILWFYSSKRTMWSPIIHFENCNKIA